ncbi:MULTISPECIES: hydrogenase formation protein HypD [unclassified Thioalkalivibrio]|uniref:hydrogenase formation protein HypD n=1 Tax=unclassified Thioalkalivibrio TaxID=2621013 RepID=UPI00035C504D|nr:MULTISPECIES: hydrogenase formation protein HypD [unclassified Thioalkalivibrio]
MRHLDEYRDPALILQQAEAIRAACTRRWTLMEVCGGQTHAILRHGLDDLLAGSVELLHGPGCPVCVTPTETLDQAVLLTRRREVMLCTFGDMLRVPGALGDLNAARAAGGDVRVIYSPLDAVALAREHPQREVVLLAVGFETTAPAAAITVLQAEALGLSNLSLLVSHSLVPPAMEALLTDPAHRIQGFLAAGHVCTVEGAAAYQAMAERFRVPIVVTGFEPVDLLAGIRACVEQLERDEARVENRYDRAARDDGNAAARDAVARVFEPVEREWRGMGRLPTSGLGLRPAYARFDAVARFGIAAPATGADGPCIAGEVLRGLRRPTDCPAFGRACTPDTPLGAPMVSSEGACAAYLHYRGGA